MAHENDIEKYKSYSDFMIRKRIRKESMDVFYCRSSIQE